MTLTRTSPALGGATVMVSRERGCLGPRATMAWHVMGFPAVGSDMVGGFAFLLTIVTSCLQFNSR